MHPIKCKVNVHYHWPQFFNMVISCLTPLPLEDLNQIWETFFLEQVKTKCGNSHSLHRWNMVILFSAHITPRLRISFSKFKKGISPSKSTLLILLRGSSFSSTLKLTLFWRRNFHFFTEIWSFFLARPSLRISFSRMKKDMFLSKWKNLNTFSKGVILFFNLKATLVEEWGNSEILFRCSLTSGHLSAHLPGGLSVKNGERQFSEQVRIFENLSQRDSSSSLMFKLILFWKARRFYFTSSLKSVHFRLAPPPQDLIVIN